MGYSTPSGAIIRMGVDGADESRRQIEAVGASMNQLSKTVETAFKTLAGAVGIGGGVAGIIQMSDAYAKFTAQLRLATNTNTEYAQSYEAVKRIAHDAQQDLAATGTLYARISNGTRELGIAQKQVADITESVALALRVSGATAEESASAQLQLSQAFASGTLRGEEFNAVNEAAPRLMLALADGIGVPVGALKDMASNGLITSAVMADVLPKALGKLREEAAQVQTIGGAFAVLKNNVMEFTAVHAQANGTVAILTSGIGLLADNLNVLFGVVQTVTAAKVGTWVASWAKETLAKVAVDRAATAATLANAEATAASTAAALAQATARTIELRAAIAATEGTIALELATNGLIPAQARAALAAEAHAAALAGQAVAARAASVGAGIAAGALGLLGGPVGLVITALGLAATAWSVWGSAAEKNSKQGTEAVQVSTADITASLDKQIEKLTERNRLAALGVPTAKGETAATSRQMEILTEIDRVGRQEGEYANLTYDARQAILASLGGQYNDLTVKIRAFNAASAEDTANKNKKSYGEWMTTYATNAEKLATELKEARQQLGDQFTPELEARIRKQYETKDAGAKKELTAYDSLIAAISTKTAENRLELEAGRDATESQKTSIKLDQDLAAGKIKLSSAHEAVARSLLVEQAASEQLLKAQAAEKDSLAYILQSTLARNAAKDALEAEYAVVGKSADTRDIEMVAIKAQSDLEKKIAQQRRDGINVTDASIAQMTREKDMYVEVTQAVMGQSKALGYVNQLTEENRRRAAESITDDKARAAALLAIDADLWKERIRNAGEGTAAQRLLQEQFNTWYAAQSKKILASVDLTKATEVLKVMESLDAAARQAASGMEASFGAVGAAIGGLTTALTGYGATQAAIAAQLAAATKDSGGDQTKIFRAQSQAAQASAQAQIRSYGDMAGAAKGFFKENSAGYKVLQTAEKAYRAYEMGLALESMAKKIFFKEAEVTANIALNATKLTGEATASAASSTLAATEASAWGVTAVVKALASLPFPANLAAGAATLAAVVAVGAKLMGSLGGGGGGGQSAAEVQKVQGTGSVFGDDSAKSDSLRRSIEQLAANSDLLIPINRGMLTSLQSIEASMSGLTNLVVRTTGLTDGTNMNIQEGTISKSTGASVAAGAQVGSMIGGYVAGPIGMAIGAVGGAIIGGIKSIWGKTTQSIVDSGLQYGGSVRDLQSGNGFDQYASVDTTKSSWFGLSKSTSNSVQTQGLNDELSKQFGLIFTNVDKSLQAAAVAMGGSAADVTKVLDTFKLDITKVSLKGLSGTALTDALNAVISKSLDEISQAAFPQFDSFRKVGEGYAETVMRIAGDYAKLDSILAATSTTFGATGIASVAARERLIELAGGIDQLNSQTNSFTQNFLSQAEQLAPVQKYVTDQLAGMSLQWVDTRDKFKNYVLDLINSGKLATEAGAQQFTALMALSDAFAKTHAATVDLTKSEQEISDERTDLQDKLDELTMTQAQLAAKARAAIDGHNLGLYDQVQAAQAAKNAMAESNTILGLQAQLYEATGDKAGAAAVLEQQRLAALKDMTPAVAAATQATWDAVDAAKARADVLTKNNALLTIQAQIYALTGNIAGAAAVLEQQHATALQTLDPALRNATQELWNLQGAASNNAAIQSFGNALADSITKAHDAAKAFRALNDALLVGDSSTLSPEQKYLEAKRQFETANSTNLESAEKAFIDASKAWFGGSAGFVADFAAVIAKNTQFASNSDASAAAAPDIWKSFQASMAAMGAAHADGGVANGWSLVGETGPELVNFTQPGRVYTASQSREMMGGSAVSMQATNTLLRQVLTELRTDKTQRGAVGTETINVLSKVVDGLNDNKRALKKVVTS